MPRSDELLVTPRRKIEWLLDSAHLPEHIETIRRYPSLSESELIDLAIEFANTGDERAYSTLRSGVRFPQRRLDEVTAEYTKRSELWARDRLSPKTLMERHRRVLRWDMTAIAGKRVTPVMLATWRQHAAGLMLFPEYRMDGSVTYRYVAFQRFQVPPIAALAHVLLALNRAGAARTGKLCQCKLSTCERFFLAARPADGMGRTIRDYCPGSDHRDQAHRADAVDRMRRSRAHRKKQPAMKAGRRSLAIK